jgi:hypothetical protein
VDEEFKEFDFALSHLVEKLEELFADGACLGSQFRTHLVGDAARHQRLLKSLDTEGRPALSIRADRPLQSSFDPNDPARLSGYVIPFPPADTLGPQTRRIGWTWLPADILETIITASIARADYITLNDATAINSIGFDQSCGRRDQDIE